MLPGTVYDEFGPAGLRELEFSHGGRQYRSRIEIKQTPKTKSQKCTLHIHTDDGGWQSVTMPDNTVSDGKTATYDRCLEWVLGPRSLYYLAAFRAQNAPKLAEYTDPKGLMRDLLALDEPATLRESAKAVARELKREYEHVRAAYEKTEEQSHQLDNLTFRISTMECELPPLVRSKTESSELVALARAGFEKATTADADNVKVRQEREQMQQRIDAARSDGTRRVAQARADLANAEERVRQHANTTAATKKQIQADVKSATDRRDSAVAILEQRDEIQRAIIDADTLAAQVEKKETDLESLRTQYQQLTYMIGQKGKLESQIEANKREGLSLRSRCHEYEKRAEFVDVVPCKGVAPYDTCPALKEVHAAKGQIVTITSEMTAKRNEWADLNAQIDAMSGEIAKLTDETAVLRDQEQALAAVRRQLTTAQALAGKLPMIEQAQAARDNAVADIESLTARAVAAKRSATDTEIALTAAVADATDRLASVQADAETAVTNLKSQLDALPIPEPSSILAVARRKLEEAEQAMSDATSAADQAHADLAEARARAKALKADIDGAESVRQHAKYLADEIAHWNLLAVGMQGVIDLSIEDAGPAIAATANNLLTEAYGPRFSCRIVTQREQANGRLVECFDISVIDSESGLESSILQKSGGESVWLDKALSDAVGIYHQDAAGVHYEGLFADESEDGLTQERKAQFYRMDRAALALGGYSRKFFISHNPESWAMADAVIDVGRWAA